MPLSVERRSLAAGTLTELAIAQVRAVQAARTATGTETERPILLRDSSYDVVQLINADLGVDLLCRSATNRVFFRRPVWSGVGRKRLHGPKFRLADPATHGEPDHHRCVPDPDHGTLGIDVWEHLHRPEAAHIEVSVIRLQLGHDAPRAHRAGAPKSLWLARAEVAAIRLPWEHAARADRRPTPGQVRRALAALMLQLGTPARAPRPRGMSPGRHAGQCPGRAPRHPAQKRGPPQRKKRWNTPP